MRKTDFAETFELLRREQRRLFASLPDPVSREGTLRPKLQIDEAIGCLELCQKHRIAPGARVTRIPEPLNLTPSSEFRLIEDQESDNRESWIEVELDGEPIRPIPGSLIIEPRRS